MLRCCCVGLASSVRRVPLGRRGHALARVSLSPLVRVRPHSRHTPAQRRGRQQRRRNQIIDCILPDASVLDFSDDSFIDTKHSAEPRAGNSAATEVSDQNSRQRAQLGDSAVLGLLCRSRPSAISGFVVPFVSHAIKLVPRGRLQPHIDEKHLKRLPSIAHGDAALPVEMEILISGVEAAATRGFPRSAL